VSSLASDIDDYTFITELLNFYSNTGWKPEQPYRISRCSHGDFLPQIYLLGIVPVGTATDYGMDGRGVGVRVLEGPNLSLHDVVQTCSEAHPTSHPIAPLLPGIKR
jgi:hypothetical protein